MRATAVLCAAVALMAVALAPGNADAAVRTLRPGTSWDWQIGGTPKPGVLANAHPTSGQKMLDVDMENTSADQIASIEAQGITAVCYIETGSWENYRSDAGQFPQEALGNTLGHYPNERYLDIN